MLAAEMPSHRAMEIVSMLIGESPDSDSTRRHLKETYGIVVPKMVVRKNAQSPRKTTLPSVVTNSTEVVANEVSKIANTVVALPVLRQASKNALQYLGIVRTSSTIDLDALPISRVVNLQAEGESRALAQTSNTTQQRQGSAAWSPSSSEAGARESPPDDSSPQNGAPALVGSGTFIFRGGEVHEVHDNASSVAESMPPLSPRASQLRWLMARERASGRAQSAPPKPSSRTARHTRVEGPIISPPPVRRTASEPAPVEPLVRAQLAPYVRHSASEPAHGKKQPPPHESPHESPHEPPHEPPQSGGGDGLSLASGSGSFVFRGGVVHDLNSDLSSDLNSEMGLSEGIHVARPASPESLGAQTSSPQPIEAAREGQAIVAPSPSFRQSEAEMRKSQLKWLLQQQTDKALTREAVVEQLTERWRRGLPPVYAAVPSQSAYRWARHAARRTQGAAQSIQASLSALEASVKNGALDLSVKNGDCGAVGSKPKWCPLLVARRFDDRV